MSSVFSDQWHLVAELKPKLRQNAVLHRHLYRNEVWYLLRDETTGQFHRFTENTYHVIGLLDGRFTLNQIWHQVCEKLGDDMPTQDEIIELLQKLYQANALNSDVTVDVERFLKRQQSQGQQKKFKQWATPFGIKVPLFQPQQTLDIYDFVGRLFFNKPFAVFMLICWLIGLNITVTHWSGLTLNLTDRLLAPDGLILMAVIYPIIKIIHEFAHAFAVTRFGGKVHEMGVMLLVFFPVPYVDATAANGFSNKYHRMLVAASGILAELTIAALALMIWVSAEEGALKALAFYVAVTAGVSSVLFNGNPLLRFDAYYVLADALELPNLATRSNQHLGYLFKKYALHLPNQLSVTDKLGEAWIFALYGSAAFVYRILIFIMIGLFVAEAYWFVGVVMIIWAGTVTLLIPAYKAWHKLLATPEVKRYPLRFWGNLSAVVGLCFTLLMAIPLPYTTDFEGTLPANQSYSVKAGAAGQLSLLQVKHGDWVEKGQVLAQLDSSFLEVEIDKLNAQLAEVRAKQNSAMADVLKLKWLNEEHSLLEAALAEKRQQLRDKTLHANQSGIWISPYASLGAYYQRGEIVGYIHPQQSGEIFAMVSEQDMALINLDSVVSLRLASKPLEEFPAQVLSISPSASKELISPILSEPGGGRIAVDDKQAAVENYFKVLVSASETMPLPFLEERLFILVQHPAEPLIYRWLRMIRQNFLSRFDV